MKTNNLTILSLLFGICCSAQETIVLTLGSDQSFCIEEPIVLSASFNIPQDNATFLWSNSIEDKKEYGHTYSLNFDTPLVQDEFVVTCKAFVESADGIKSYLSEVTLTPNEPIEWESSFDWFINKDNIIVEQKVKTADFDFVWIDGDGNESSGKINKYNYQKGQKMQILDYKISDVNGCSIQLRDTIEIKEVHEDKSTESFGSNEDDEIPTKLFREITKDVPVYESLLTGDEKEETFLSALPGYQFTIVGEIEDDYIIRFWSSNEKEIIAKLDSERRSTISTKDFIINYLIKPNADKFMLAGKFLDKNLEPLIGANVLEKNTSNGAITGLDGSFHLIVESETPEIKISYTGFSEHLFSPSPEKYKFRKGLSYIPTFVLKEKGGYRYFRMDKGHLEMRSVPFLPKKGAIHFTAGTTVVPVKLRFQKDNFEFSRDIGLGPFAGIKIRAHSYRQHFLSLGLTVGISSVELNKFNANSNLIPEVQNVAAFTFGFGVLYEVEKAQLGLFFGWDKISHNSSKIEINNEPLETHDWTYQSKIWVSFGFGYSLITRPENSESKKDPSVN